MSDGIDWSILQPVDVGGRFQQGYEHAQQNALQRQEVAYQLRERARAEGERNALSGALNPVTGAIDPIAARRAYVGAGDLTGAMAFDASQRTQHQADLEQHRDRIIMGAQFLQGVTDEAGYQRALALAQQNGIQINDVPPHYDQQYVQGVIQVAQHLQAVEHPQAPQQPPNIQREVDYYRSIGRDDLAQQLIARHAYGQPNPDGTYSVPPGVQGGAAPPRVLTDDDIRRMEAGGGAGQPQAQGTFPRQDGSAFDFSIHPAGR